MSEAEPKKSDSEKGDEKSKDEVVPKSAYEGVSNDLHKWKKLAKESEQKLAEMQEKLAALDVKSKEDGNDYKSLYDAAKKEVAAEKKRADKLNESFLYGEKHRAVYGELKKLGLRDDAEKYLEYEDLKDLEVETTSKGRVNVLGVREWAVSYHEKNKPLFDLKKTPGVSSTDGRSNTNHGSGDVTPAMVVDAERVAKKSGKPEDRDKYLGLVKEYNKQRQRRA